MDRVSDLDESIAEVEEFERVMLEKKYEELELEEKHMEV